VVFFVVGNSSRVEYDNVAFKGVSSPVPQQAVVVDVVNDTLEAVRCA
jgi:hypothetical protein